MTAEIAFHVLVTGVLQTGLEWLHQTFVCRVFWLFYGFVQLLPGSHVFKRAMDGNGLWLVTSSAHSRFIKLWLRDWHPCVGARLLDAVVPHLPQARVT